MTTPEPTEGEAKALARYQEALDSGLSDAEAREDGWPDCQREGTCCMSCYADTGSCCKHGNGRPPLWALETS